MKRTLLAIVFAGILAEAAGAAERDPWIEDEPGEALWTWNAGPAWRVGVEYTRDERSVKMGGIETPWTGDTVEGVVQWAPTAWMDVEGRLGAGRGKVDWLGAGRSGMGFAWGLGAGVDLCELAPEGATWRVFLRTEAGVRGRSGEKRDTVQVRWTEYTASLPVIYELMLERSPRSAYSTDFHRFDLFAGPQWSHVDGEWKGFGATEDFDGKRTLGAMVGATIWLSERVGFWGRVDIFDECGYKGGVEYRF